MSEPILATANLTRRFGGLTAVDGVTLELRDHSIHAIIGPNGAGKSTLVNLLSGELKASAGNVRLRGEDITDWTPDRIALRGVARTFQHSNLFPSFTAFENCRLAAQSRDTGLARCLTRCLRPAESYREWNDAADRALAIVGLAMRGRLSASALSHGERRALEIAMSLATAPSILLLDEPLAGMGAEESGRIVGLLKQLSVDHAILLIEHDMDAVFALADCLTVMVNGAVLASGSPEAIRANPDVQRAYLGADPTLVTA
jgi:branched-chain amino acid transport system ATP-binding protein